MAVPIFSDITAPQSADFQSPVDFQKLHERLSMLKALLQNTRGVSTEGFNHMGEEQRALYPQHSQDMDAPLVLSLEPQPVATFATRRGQANV